MSKRNVLPALAALALAACSPMTPRIPDTPITVTLATATPGGGFPVYGAAFAQAIHEADPTLAVAARNTRGSAENIPLLEADAIDLALVQGEAAYEALAGIGRSAPAKLRIVSAMYSSPGMFVERAGDGPALVLNGRVAALWGGGIGWPGFHTMARSPVADPALLHPGVLRYLKDAGIAK
jgi:TRAP transporter TAXI family solute receptor